MLKTLTCVLVLMTSSAAIAENRAGLVKTVSSISAKGEVVIFNASGQERRAKQTDPVYVGDKIVTGDDQTVTIELSEQSELVLGPSSSFLIEKHLAEQKKNTLLHLFYGMVRALVTKTYAKDEMFVLKTKDAVMGVRGTEFVAKIDSKTNETRLHTLQGKVALGSSLDSLQNAASHVVVSAGHSSLMRPGMKLPETPKAFDASKFRKEMRSISPQFEKQISPPSTTDRSQKNVNKLEGPQHRQTGMHRKMDQSAKAPRDRARRFDRPGKPITGKYGQSPQLPGGYPPPPGTALPPPPDGDRTGYQTGSLPPPTGETQPIFKSPTGTGMTAPAPTGQTTTGGRTLPPPPPPRQPPPPPPPPPR